MSYFHGIRTIDSIINKKDRDDNMQNAINIIATIIVSVGGTGVIIVAISKYIGNILAKRIEEKYKNKLDKELEDYKWKINEKLSKLDKYFIVSENVEAKVLVRTYPYGQKIEVTIPTEYVLLRAEVVDQDLYNAIDLVIDKLEGQIRKYKTRLNRKSKDNKLAFNLASIEPLEEEEEDVLVKTKTITPKPMDMEEAIMQMELIGHSFFVYRDTETDAISIVYRRNDGDYGLIETE